MAVQQAMPPLASTSTVPVLEEVKPLINPDGTLQFLVQSKYLSFSQELLCSFNSKLAVF